MQSFQVPAAVHILILLLGSIALVRTGSVVKPQVRWAQSNSTLFLELRPPKGGSSCGELVAEIFFDRIVVSTPCADAQQQWDLELREDVWSEDSRLEQLPQKRGLLLLLRKRLQHRWDRPLMEEASFALPRDWRREDTSLPEEDEIELPRAQNIKGFKSRSELEQGLQKMQTLVIAMRYPWCMACEEKDKAFVKVSKLAGGKKAFVNVTYGTLDLREEKDMARKLWGHNLHNCSAKYKGCPLMVFKPDEPLDEPYQLHVHLLYEVDEAAMMADPLTGMPGHSPKGQVAKPDYERFERDLSLLLPPAVSYLNATEPKLPSLPTVVGSNIPITAFRQAARQLRGTTFFSLAPQVEGPSIRLWRWDELGKRVIDYDQDVENLNASYLEHFARVHSQPLLQNYSWTLKDQLDGIGMPIGVLWVNHSDTNSSNITARALTAFSNLCNKRRGTNSSRHILCCVMDQSNAYHQRDYGSHEPYPFPFFGLTQKLGFHAGDRYGYPFREPVNASVLGFFSNSKSATRNMDAFVGKVLRGRVAPSHESNLVPNRTWIRGEVQEVVWKTYQKEINGSTADILLELYDDQRKKHHTLSATMEVIAKTLKDYRDLKVARMEVSQNYVPPIFGRKQFSKDTEYYWIPPSLASGEWTPTDPIRYANDVDEVTPGKLLRFLKKHTLSSWSLKEALESSDDISEEIMGYARQQQQADDRAEADKQQMIKKMMTTLKKEKGLVDVNEMIGLRKAAETLGETKPDSKPVKMGKGAARPPEKLSAEEMEERRQKRREELRKEDDKQKEIARKDKEKRKQRKEVERLRKEKKKAEEEKRRAEAVKVAEEKRRQKEAERLRLVATPLFSWGQSKDQIRVSIAIPGMQKDSLQVNLTTDRVAVSALDWQTRRYSLNFELREFVVPDNSSWNLRSSEDSSRLEGVLILLQKSILHRWDRLAQNHSAVKNFLRKDWVQDDGEMEEEKEEVELPSGPNIKKVSATGLQRLLEKHSLVVAAPRYPWCDKCKEKDREFTKAARSSRTQDHLDSVSFVVLDAREEKYFARKHNASCTDACELLMFKEDEPEEPYAVPGRRFAEEIQVDCYKHLLPVVSIINNKTHFDRVLTAFDTAIMGFFQRNASDSWFHRFRQVARELRGHALFGAVFNGSPAEMGIDFRVASEVEADGRPLVLLFKPKENRHVEFTGELTLEKLSHFSKVLSLPLLSQYTPESRQKYIELQVPLGMLWLDGEDADRPENLAAKEVAQRLAIRFSGHLVFVTLNNTRDGFLLRPFGLDPRRVPCFGLSSSEAPEANRFAYEPEVTSTSDSFWLQSDAFQRLEAFCSAFLNGTLEASHESAELPKSYRWPGPGRVEEVVWKTFRSSLAGENLLLELYSPYRPQHRTHLVVLDLVAEALANVTTLKVARMDTANNYVLPEFELKDKEKSSSVYFRGARSGPWRRFAPKGGAGRAEELPKQMLRFLHREMKSAATFDLSERLNWVNAEALIRIRRLKALEKDYEKKMQDEWMQKEMEEFERYKRLGKFDNINL